MTLKVYLFHHKNYLHTDYEKEMQQLKTIDPDKILLFCLEEFAPEQIFRKLIDKLSPWLVENNKIAKILKCDPDNQILAPNIITEKTFAYYLSLMQCHRNFEKLNIDFTKSHLLATKLFTCYNSNPKFHRGLTIDALARENLLNDCFYTVHFPYVYNNDEDDGLTKFEYKYFDKKVKYDEADYDRHSPRFDSSYMAQSFLTGFIDLVTESTHHKQIHILSEKTTKSIFALKPFIVVGTQHFHKFLYEEYGIEMYNELFDYSFDSEPNIVDRVEGVVENIKRIKATYSVEERDRIHDLLLPKMMKNKTTFLEYGLSKNKMIPDSLKFMFTNEPYEFYGDVKDCKYVFEYYKMLKWLE